MNVSIVKKDEPTILPGRSAYELELTAMRRYREKYSDGPIWQELHVETRMNWMEFVENEMIAEKIN